MGDDWKGEGLIRKSVTKSESKSEVRRLVSTIAHKNRRAAGIPVPAAKTHGALMRAILYDANKPK
jgi:hypothetical protein